MTGKVIDLSIPCSAETPGLRVKLRDDPPVYLGHECYAHDLEIDSHTGTYLETSAHLFRDGRTTDSIPPDRLILPGRRISITHDRRCIDASDLESACGPMPPPPGSAILIHTPGTHGEEFRYFSRDAARWLADRRVSLMGSDTPLYDSGFEDPTGFFVELFEADIPIIANITNLDLLPAGGFTLIVLPLRIAGVCTVPCRVIAVVGDNEGAGQVRL